MKLGKELFDVKAGTSLSFGVTKVSDGVQFAVQCPPDKKCTLNLYRIGRKEPSYKIELTDKYRHGGACFMKLCIKGNAADAGQRAADILSKKYEYTYEIDGREFADSYAQIIHGRNQWGKRKKDKEKAVERAGICLEEFNWENDAQLRIPFDELILYQLHVRGYTRHSSSGVTNKGTFKGLEEKIPYIKELGVNGVLLLPCYEFNEILSGDNRIYNRFYSEKETEIKLNYWGYGMAGTYYMAPKTSYACDTVNAASEFKELVKAFHKAGIEVLMDIYFSPGTNVCLMTDCLRGWVLNYHIDGFRINQDVMPSIILASDPILSGVKLLASYWDMEGLYRMGAVSPDNALAEYNEGFMNDARRFLKSDEGMVETFAGRFRRNPKDYAVINYITYVNGFTLNDLVSYDIKHNETNGENNRDGAEYNYSWNCGTEGKTRKRLILERRMRQMRNAMMMLLCSQATPMIFAGDEFCNTQLGNNNPYCHDDMVTWLNWKHNKRSVEFLDFVKNLIAFRKLHPVLHQKKETAMMDYKGVGMPDLSIHGTQAWKADYYNYSRMLAILLCGKYAERADGTPDDNIYIIFNMYWENKEFDLPNLPLGMEWFEVVNSHEGAFREVDKIKTKDKKWSSNKVQKVRKVTVLPRTIAIYIGKKN